VTDRESADQPTAADPGSAAVDVRTVAEDVFGIPGYEVICRYRDILASRGIDWGLLGPREVDRLWDRHILNSTAVTDLIPESAAVADVGSGAGLPGIPVALLRADVAMDLIEPLLRRSSFLTHTVDDLGITSTVCVRRSRAEDVAQRYDVVLSRALAPLDRLIRWCLPLMKPSGRLVAIKGASASDEVARHARLIENSGLRAEVLTVTSDARIAPTTVIQLQMG